MFPMSFQKNGSSCSLTESEKKQSNNMNPTLTSKSGQHRKSKALNFFNAFCSCFVSNC